MTQFVTFEKTSDTLIVKLYGRLDTMNSEKVSDEVDNELNNSKCLNLVFDLEKLEYVSSAGIRLLLLPLCK